MKYKNKFSIITVCFNAQNTIQRCINSILTQSYGEIELIVIDGMSTDSTIQLIQEFEI